MSEAKRDIETVVAQTPLTEAEAFIIDEAFAITISEPMTTAVEGEILTGTNSNGNTVWSTFTYATEGLWDLYPNKRRTEVKLYKSILK